MANYIARIRASLGHPPPAEIVVSEDVWAAIQDEAPQHKAPQVKTDPLRIYDVPVVKDADLPVGTIELRRGEDARRLP